MPTDKQRAQVRASNRARYAAYQRLVAAHRAEFDRLYAEEARKRGVIARTDTPKENK